MVAKSDKSKKPEVKKLTDKERVDKGQVLARIIIEVLGAPKDYVEEAIQIVVDRVRSTKEIEVVSESTFEAEERGKLFCTFTELEMWFDNLDVLSNFLFEFTPSSVEIMQPSHITVDARFVSGFFNDFLLKMHELGLKVKDTSATVQLLQKNADALIRNFISYSLSSCPKSADEIASATGIPKDNAAALLSNFEKAGVAKKEGDKYSFVKKK